MRKSEGIIYDGRKFCLRLTKANDARLTILAADAKRSKTQTLNLLIEQAAHDEGSAAMQRLSQTANIKQ